MNSARRKTSSRIVAIQETSGNWAGLLRRQLIGDDVEVIRVETLAELSDRVQDAPFGCFALQVTKTPSPSSVGSGPSVAAGSQPSGLPDFDVLDWIIDAADRFPQATFCGLSNRPVVHWPVCEAGAALVLDHPLEIVKLAQLVRRHLAARYVAQIDPETSVDGTENVVESLWLKLPWADHATPTQTNE